MRVSLAQDARKRIRRPTRRERHDHGDGMRWIALRMGNAANADRDGNCRDKGRHLHGCPRRSAREIFPADDDTERGGKVNSIVTSM
jgi:hypothetical protein